ncbi:Small subunit processome component [Blyttiomyces sp. JEL0837]|nr:Small subunit processome component [Blyttiomyces sp. JEL0837]
MKTKRAKKNKKFMSAYVQSFGFREPYQILLTTACVRSELKKLGRNFADAFMDSSRYEIRRCNHHPYISGAKCLASIIGEDNKHKYGVATQDAALRSSLRQVPGVPLVYITSSAFILEPLSYATQDKIKEIEKGKLAPKVFEQKTLEKLAPKEPEPLPPPPRKKKAKGPNPLSVKKKKKPPAPPVNAKKKEPKVADDGTPYGQNDAGKNEKKVEDDAETGSKRKRAEDDDGDDDE